MIHVVTEQDIEQNRAALIAWAEANGLDPKRMTRDGLIIEKNSDHQVVSFTEYVLDADGRKILDLTTPHRFQLIHRTRTIRHALPEGIGQPMCTCTLGRLNPSCPDHVVEPDV